MRLFETDEALGILWMRDSSLCRSDCWHGGAALSCWVYCGIRAGDLWMVSSLL